MISDRNFGSTPWLQFQHYRWKACCCIMHWNFWCKRSTKVNLVSVLNSHHSTYLMLKHFRKLYITDARPRKNALANGAMGGGSESSSNYFQSEVLYIPIISLFLVQMAFSFCRSSITFFLRLFSLGLTTSMVWEKVSPV